MLTKISVHLLILITTGLIKYFNNLIVLILSSVVKQFRQLKGFIGASGKFRRMKGSDSLYDVFIADCKREMRLRKLSNGDLAKKIGYKKSTVDAFFADLTHREKSGNVAKAISEELCIKL